jgi:folate-dependent phosphoribosylglycinamide formyltransferase PurN
MRSCDSSSIVYNYLKQYFDFEAVIVEKNFTKKRQLTRRIKRLGFWYAMGQAAFMVLVYPLLRSFSQKRKNEIIKKYNLNLEPLPSGSFIQINSLNNDSSRKLLSELNPDLIIVNGTRIISKKTLDCVAAPFINIHVGITPLFRGVHGGYWAMATGRKDLFGVTLHYVDAGVDTGGIIEQVIATPEKKDNLFTYPYLKYGVCMPVLKNVIEKFESGQKPEPKTSIVKESALWYHPTIFEWLKNLRRTFIIIFVTTITELLPDFFYNNLCPVF